MAIEFDCDIESSLTMTSLMHSTMWHGGSLSVRKSELADEMIILLNI